MNQKGLGIDIYQCSQFNYIQAQAQFFQYFTKKWCSDQKHKINLFIASLLSFIFFFIEKYQNKSKIYPLLFQRLSIMKSLVMPDFSRKMLNFVNFMFIYYHSFIWAAYVIYIRFYVFPLLYQGNIFYSKVKTIIIMHEIWRHNAWNA